VVASLQLDDTSVHLGAVAVAETSITVDLALNPLTDDYAMSFQT
jgi:hypothetical protein